MANSNLHIMYNTAYGHIVYDKRRTVNGRSKCTGYELYSYTHLPIVVYLARAFM